jgi:hypothetical protein
VQVPNLIIKLSLHDSHMRHNSERLLNKLGSRELGGHGGLSSGVNEFRSDVRLFHSFGSVDAFADTLKAVDMFHGQHTTFFEPIEVVSSVRLFELTLKAKSGFQHQYNTGHYTGRRE